MHAIAWKSFWQERSFLATKMPALEAYCSDMCSDNVAVKLGDQRLRTTSGRDWLPSLSTTVLFHTHLHAWTTLAYEVALRLVDAGNQFWIKKCDFALVLCARRCLETRLKKNQHLHQRICTHWTPVAATCVAPPSKSNPVIKGFEQLPVAIDHPSLSTTAMSHMHVHARTTFAHEAALILSTRRCLENDSTKTKICNEYGSIGNLLQ